MPIDASIYGNQQQPNMLATMGSMAQTGNLMNQNRLFSQEFAARKAMGPIFQQSIDPQSGQLDTNKLMLLSAQNPDTAFKAPEIAQQALERQGAQTTIQGQELEQAIKRQGQVRQSIASQLANPNASPTDVISSLGQLVANKVLTTEQATQALASMPQDQQKFRPWLQQQLIQSMDGERQLQAMYGQIQTVNTGGQTNIVAASPLAGVRPMGSIQNTMAPGDAASPVQVINPQTGQEGIISKAQFAGQNNNPQQAPNVPPSPGAPDLGPGHYASPATPPGFMPTKLPPGAAAAADVAGRGGAEQGLALQQTADAVPMRKAMLGEMEASLNNFTSGPGADWKKVGKSLVNANNPFGNVFDPKSIASQETFNKQSTQLALQQIQALGGTGTDDKLGSSIAANPNDAISKMGNQQILQLLKGNEDAIAVKNREWQNFLQAGNSPAAYGQFSADFNKQYDPRVFQSVYMGPEQKAEIVKSMNPTEKQNFRNSFNMAVERGWIPDPRQQNAQ
jgi:hypothetical protein